MIPKPPAHLLPYGFKVPVGLGTSEVIADFDFETYSPAGFVWNPLTNKFDCPRGASKKGLPVVGTAVYSEHPDAEVLCMAYNLKNGKGVKQWIPGQELPHDLFTHLAQGRLIEAHNAGFERWIWNNVCRPKYGFPELPEKQLRCSAAKARAFALPGALGDLSEVLNLTNKKDKEGKRLIQKFCIPHDPTKNNKLTRNYLNVVLDTNSEDVFKFRRYNIQDIIAEAEASLRIPDLSPQELEFWQCDQRINQRGVQIDIESVNAAINIIEQAYEKYNRELRIITRGEVQKASEVAKISSWLQNNGLAIYNLDDGILEDLLNNPHQKLHPGMRRVLEIRQMLASASVKKLYAMLNQSTREGRVHDLFVYHSARTGRAAGSGPQPQNLPKSGPAIQQCNYCKKYFPYKSGWDKLENCPWCNSQEMADEKEWNYTAVEEAFTIIKQGNLELTEYFYGNAIALISGCLRGMFIAKEGYGYISSDYNAIEAVASAALAKEKWRLEVFSGHGMIYEMSASKITGIPLEEFIRHKQTTGSHHPARDTGKTAELASGFGGWVDAWKNFGAGELYSDDEIETYIKAWRAASPNIVEMWGGHKRNWQEEFYGLEGMAMQAIQYPGKEFSYNGIAYLVKEDILYCRLLSGRYLTYHRPRLDRVQRTSRKGNTWEILQISYESWNTNPLMGKIGWVRMTTYGPKQFENVVQAHAREFLMTAIVRLEHAGYPIVLHVHDDLTSEVLKGFGSVEEFEKIMSQPIDWAPDWPIRASGGWRGKRYRK